MIDVENLSMHYGSTIAVDNISFHAKKGEILGLLGPNGAGKSTTMKILTTFIVPAAGSCRVGGLDVVENALEVRKMIGYLPETAPLYVDMTVRDYLDFVGNARGLSQARLLSRIGWVVEACGLMQVYYKLINELSRGYRQRVGLAQALIHDPEVLVLDEPTSGLDPLQIVGIRELIKELGREKTIIFSTHILQEVVAVSDRVIIINEGRIIADGSVDELRHRAARQNKSILTLKASKTELEAALGQVDSISSFRLIKETNGLVSYEIFNDFDKEVWEDIDRIIKENGWPVKEYHDSSILFEDAFLTLTREAKKGGVEV